MVFRQFRTDERAKATIHDTMLAAQDSETEQLARLRWRVMLGIFSVGSLAMGASTLTNLASGELGHVLTGVSFWVFVLLGAMAGTQFVLRRPSVLLERLALSGVCISFIYQFVNLINKVYAGDHTADLFAELVPWLSVIYVAAFIVFPVRWASWLVASLLSFIGLFWGRRVVFFELDAQRFFGAEALSDTLISSLIVVTLLFFFKRVTEVGARSEVRVQALETLAHTDSLTGLHNRRYLAKTLQIVYARAHSHDQELSVVMCDLDHFKAINDHYSHAVGDRVLVEVAKLLKNCTRHDDLVSRHGGEEFVLVLPRTDHASALEVCEKMRRVIEGFDWSALHPDLRVTASFGLCSRREASHEAMLAEADKQLYLAKNAGRNRVTSVV